MYTDHGPLVYLFTLTDPSSRLTKFRLALEEYNFDVYYKKGCENAVADALSRISTTELRDMHEKLSVEAFVTTRMQSKKENKNSFKEVVTGHDTSSGNIVELKVQNYFFF